jgi:RNA polymerase sigma factor (sigma-70 family)
VRDYLEEGTLNCLPAVAEAPFNAELPQMEIPQVCDEDDDLTRLITTKQGLLVGYAMKYGRVRIQAAAEDIVSISLIAALEKSLAGWRPEYSWETYIKKIIHNRSIDYHRQSASERSKVRRLEASRDIPDFPEPDDLDAMEAYSSERYRVADECLRRLPIEHQQAFVLYVQGQDQNKIAEVLSVSQPTVSRWITKTRDALLKMPEIQEIQ